MSYPGGSGGGLLGDFPQSGRLLFISLLCHLELPPLWQKLLTFLRPLTGLCCTPPTPGRGVFPQGPLQLLAPCLWGSNSRVAPALLGLAWVAPQAVLCTRAPSSGDEWGLMRGCTCLEEGRGGLLLMYTRHVDRGPALGPASFPPRLTASTWKVLFPQTESLLHTCF